MVNLPKFQKAWSNAKKNIFRLEALPEYRIKRDFGNFKNFLKGKQYISHKEKKWFKLLRKTKEKGISIKRVRLVHNPISDYLKYEIDFWQNSTKYGEKIQLLDDKKYKKIIKPLKFKPEDFWMFDNKVLILLNYNSKGNFIKEEMVNNKKLIDKYKKLKLELIEYSISIKHFLKI